MRIPAAALLVVSVLGYARLARARWLLDADAGLVYESNVGLPGLSNVAIGATTSFTSKLGLGPEAPRFALLRPNRRRPRAPA
jgi:hypothetical protein